MSFGDFTQDELNTYLINKKLNNTNKATEITEANESKVDNNKSDSQQNQVKFQSQPKFIESMIHKNRSIYRKVDQNTFKSLYLLVYSNHNYEIMS